MDRSGVRAADDTRVVVGRPGDLPLTLSHHHTVGTEHARWLEEDISAPGVTMVRALFDGMDPGANLNPGTIV
jgi:alkyldihydroxyacetonephosphate synthase